MRVLHLPGVAQHHKSNLNCVSMWNISTETCDSQTSCWITALLKTFCQNKIIQAKDYLELLFSDWNTVTETQIYPDFNVEFLCIFSRMLEDRMSPEWATPYTNQKASGLYISILTEEKAEGSLLLVNFAAMLWGGERSSLKRENYKPELSLITCNFRITGYSE